MVQKVGARVHLGLVVEKGSDLEDLTLKIASKDKVFEVNAGNIPPSVNLGDWIISNSEEFATVRESSKIPLKSKVEDNKVQVFTYIAVPLGHSSTRDGYVLPKGASVWSPHFGFAYSEYDLMFGLKDEILYEAWLEYRNGASDGEPIWELIMVGRPLVDPEITILLRNAPWKLYTRREERGDTSLSAVLSGGLHELDGYLRGLVIAIVYYPEPAVVLFCRNYDGHFVVVDEKNVSKSVFMKLAIGQVVKFREMTNILSNAKCPRISEILLTTQKDIIFEGLRNESCQIIKILTSVKIAEELVLEGELERTVDLISEYGRITVNREKFEEDMKRVFMTREDLVKAKKEGKELQVWIAFVPVSNSWTIDRINADYFKSKSIEE